MVTPLAAAGVGLAYGAHKLIGGKTRARQERDKLESERRQRITQEKGRIDTSSATGVGSVDVNSVDYDYLESADQPQSDFVRDPTFFGAVLSGISKGYNDYQLYR